MDIEKRVRSLVETPVNTLIFQDQVKLLINSINRDEVTLHNMPSNIRYSYGRTKSLASHLILNTLDTKNLAKEINGIIAAFWATVIEERAARGFAGDPEDGLISPHVFLSISPRRTRNVSEMLFVRAMGVIAELEHAISMNWEGLTQEERGFIPVIIADCIVEAQAALDASIVVSENGKLSISEEEIGFVLNRYKQGIHWQNTILDRDSDKKDRKIKSLTQLAHVLERMERGKSMTTGCWDVLEATGELAHDTGKATKAFEALRKQVLTFQKDPEKYLLNKPSLPNWLRKRLVGAKK